MDTLRRWPGLWVGFVVGGALAAPAFIGLRAAGAPVAAGGLFTALSFGAAVAVIGGVWRFRPAGRAGWLLIGAGQLVYAAGDAVYLVRHQIHGNGTFPSLADALYLAQYPLLAGGLASFARRRAAGRNQAPLLDAGILAIAAGLLSWVYLMGPLTAAKGMTATARVVTVAYPVGDLLVLVIGVRMVLGGGARSPSFRMLMGSLLAMLAADTWSTLRGGAAAAAACVLWLLTYALLGGAALHPSMRGVDEPATARPAPATAARVVGLGAASLLAPVVLLVQYETGKTRDIPVIAIACALLFLLVLGRMAGLVADQHRIAATDALTSLATRRAFEERLHGRRRGRAVGVILLDVDHFKRINDAHGHPAGDRVLREVARRLRAEAGPGATVARYGGEEFALLVPDAKAPQTAALADRLRAAVGSAPIHLGGAVLRSVTVSAGTAVLPADTEEPGELVLFADRALYAAKRSGRDRVVAANALPAALCPGAAASALTAGAFGHGVAAAAVIPLPSEGDEWPTPLPRHTELEAA